MASRFLRIIALLFWVGAIFFTGIVYARVTPPAQTNPTLKVSWTIRNAYFNKHGVAWAAATEEQRKKFLIAYPKTPPFAQTSPTLKVSWTIRNAYFNKHEVAWTTVTEEQRKKFLKELAGRAQEQQKKFQIYQKKKNDENIRKQVLARQEAARSQARLKAEQQIVQVEHWHEQQRARKVAELKQRQQRLQFLNQCGFGRRIC